MSRLLARLGTQVDPPVLAWEPDQAVGKGGPEPGEALRGRS